MSFTLKLNAPNAMSKVVAAAGVRHLQQHVAQQRDGHRDGARLELAAPRLHPHPRPILQPS